jgi:hypothetical protein
MSLAAELELQSFKDTRTKRLETPFSVICLSDLLCKQDSICYVMNLGI